MAFNPSDLWCLLIFPGEKMYHLRSIMRARPSFASTYLDTYAQLKKFSQKELALSWYIDHRLGYHSATAWLPLGYNSAAITWPPQKRCIKNSVMYFSPQPLGHNTMPLGYLWPPPPLDHHWRDVKIKDFPPDPTPAPPSTLNDKITSLLIINQLTFPIYCPSYHKHHILSPPHPSTTGGYYILHYCV